MKLHEQELLGESNIADVRHACSKLQSIALINLPRQVSDESFEWARGGKHAG